MPNAMPLARDTKLPTITVVTPSFNQAEFLEEAIESVLSQKYPALQYVVMDGGSTDGSVEVIKRYEGRLFYWVSEPDDGYTDAVNRGWQQGNGEILGWLNADDVFLPNCLQRVGEEYLRSEFVAFAGETLILNRDGRQIGQKGAASFDPVRLLTGLKPGAAATFYGRRALNEVGPLRLDLVSNPDREFMLRIGAHYAKELVRTIDVPLAAWRKWEETVTAMRGAEAVTERIAVVDEYADKITTDPQQAKIIRRRAVTRIYRQQARRELERGDVSAYLRYRWRAFRNEHSMSNGLGLVAGILKAAAWKTNRIFFSTPTANRKH